MRRRKLIVTAVLVLCGVFLSAQKGFYINGPDASLNVAAGSTLSVLGNFGVIKCHITEQVRFAGTLYVTDSLKSNDVLKFNPSSALTSKQCRVVFRTSNTSAITGTFAPQFWELEVNKTTGGAVHLMNDIICKDTLTFTSGFLYPHNNQVILQDPSGTPLILNHPWIKAERNGSQFMSATAVDTGKVVYNTIYTGTLNFPAANAGFSLSGPVNVGSPVKVMRGFHSQSNCANLSLGQYFEIESSGHVLTNNTLTLRYHFNDANNFALQSTNLSLLTPYFSNRNDINWTPVTFSLPLGPLGAGPPLLDPIMVIPLSQLRDKNMLADSSSFRVVIANPNCANPPQSALLLDTLHICNGDSVTLDAGNLGNVTGYNLRYSWSTPNAAYSRTLVAKPNTQFQKYKVRLMDARGCVTFDSIVIAPSAPFPQIHYLNYLNACVGDSVTLKDSVTISTGSFTNSLQFSNNSVLQSNAKKVKHFFSSAGTYSVLLSSTSNFGCVSTVANSGITVYNLPTVSFNTGYNCVNKQMNFTSTSVPNHTALVINSNKWKFNSNDSAIGNSAARIYSIAGLYNATLTSSSNFGCKNSASQSFTIYPFNTASFSKNNTCLGDTCVLINQSTCLTGSCNLIWNLGDNTTTLLDSIKKVYTAAGLKNVLLKIVAPVGCPDSIAIPVFVNPRPIPAFALNSSTLCNGDQIQITNTSSISTGAINNYNWQINGQTFSNNWNTAYTPVQVGTHTITLNLQSDSACQASSFQTFTVHALPPASFYGAPVCEGSMSTFTALGAMAGASYSFYPQSFASALTNSSGIFTYSYSSSGNFTPSLQITSAAGCSATTAIQYVVKSKPTAPFTGSISTCGTQYSLDAQNTGSQFLWLPGNQTTQIVTCTQNNLYKVSITNTNNCQIQSQVYLKLNAEVKPQLGNDTTVCGKLLLNAGYAGSQYSWNTTQTTQTILAQQTGQFKVNVLDQNNCSGSDSILVTILTVPTVTATSDITLCKPLSPLTLTVSGTAQSYSWSTGQIGTSQQTSVGGQFLVVGTASNGCKSQDTVVVQILATPTLNLGGNQASCAKKILTAFLNNETINWHTGSTQPSYTVNSTETVWALVTNTVTGCSARDTAKITIHGYPQFELGKDTISCSATPIVIGANIPNCTFLWNNLASSPTLMPQSSGLYGLTITNNAGCSSTDYLQITNINSPEINLGPSIRYLCNNTSFTLANVSPGQFYWQKNHQSFSTASLVTIEEAAQYNLTVSQSGCRTQDSVLVVSSNQTVQANFLAATFDTINRAVKFVNLSKPNITAAFWDFGDGTNSSEFHPTHTWFLPTDYSVTLTVGNNFCTNTITKQLALLFREAQLEKENASAFEIKTFLLYPNPSCDQFTVHADISKKANAQIVIADALGNLIFEDTIENSIVIDRQYTLSNSPSGIYFIKITASNERSTISKALKLIIEK